MDLVTLARRFGRLTLVLLLMSLIAGCCCCLSPDDLFDADGVISSDSGATTNVEKLGFTVEVPQSAEVETMTSVYVSVLMIMKAPTGDGVTFTVYEPHEPLTPESLETHLEDSKKELLETWPQSKFTDVEMEIFGQNAKGIEHQSNDSLPGMRKFVVEYPEQGRLVEIEVNVWPPRDQAFVDKIIATAKYDPNAPMSEEESPEESETP